MSRLDLPPVWGAFFALAATLWAGAVDLAPLGASAVPAGRSVMAAGLGFVLWAALWFWRRETPIEPRRTPRALLTEGPYRLTRNPIYRGLVMIVAGWALTEGEATALIAPALYARVLWVRFVLPEEAAVRAAFGPEWEAWAARTRWRL